MQSQTIQHLLAQVKSLNVKYEKLAQLSGENFNIFKILKLHTSEVKLHSNFLAELLNPNGSHGHKDAFLNLFFSLYQFKGNAFNSARANVTVEKHLGVINEHKTEGGRVDILIHDNNHNHIVIENKIYAPDQQKQLVRYNFHYPDADLFYLTLDGRVCEEATKDGLRVDEHYKCLSYRDDISKWLELCRKEAATNPTLRETITQYLYLIKYLCNQAVNDNMANELTELMNANIEASFTITNNLTKATDYLIKKLVEDLKSMSKEYEDSGFLVKCDLDLHKKYTEFSLSRNDWQYASIKFQMQEYGRYGLVYGIGTNEDMNIAPFPEDMKIALTTIGAQFDQSPWWLINRNFEYPYKNNWAISYEPWIGITNGELLASIRIKLDDMIKLIGDLKL